VGRTTRERRERREAPRVRSRRTGDTDRHLVARDFTLEIQLAIEPPDRRMPARNHAHEVLDELREVVMALHVHPLVNDDAIEIGVAELLQQRR
jgi:hypothetical protein